MYCCFRTALTAFTWTSRGWRGKVGHRYGILLLLATDAAQRPGLNVVLCGHRLFQQYVVDACAKMEQQRLTICSLIRTISALDAVLANDGDRAGRRLLNFIHVVCNESN